MIKNSENGTDINSSMLEKKEWVRPQMTQLNVKETKGGENNWVAEDSFLGGFIGGYS